MSISSKLLQVNQVKQDIKDAIVDKGIDMTDTPFTNYADKIDSIPVQKEEEEKTVSTPSFASGNIVVEPTTNKVMTKVTVNKDTTNHIASNIRNGKTLYGVTGNLQPAKEEETKTITEPNFSSGNVVVTPTTGKVMTQVTINKDSNLIAGNIKDGVTLFGVTGDYEGVSSYNLTLNTEAINNSSSVKVYDGPFKNGELLYSDYGYNANNVNLVSKTGYITIEISYQWYNTTDSSGIEVVHEWATTTYQAVTFRITTSAAIINFNYYFCFVEGTLITLADGSKKPIEEIDYSDKLLVWNFDEGKQDVADIVWIAKESKAPVYWEVIFSNGTTLGLVGAKNKSHRLFNVEQGKFVYPQDFKEGEHTVDENGILLTIASCIKKQEEVLYYNLATTKRLNNYANSILTGSRFTNIYPIENMKYIKDNRKFVPRKEYQEIPDNYFYGLRLAEQPKETNANAVNYFNTTKEHVIHNYIEHEKYWTGEKDYKSWEFKRG